MTARETDVVIKDWSDLHFFCLSLSRHIAVLPSIPLFLSVGFVFVCLSLLIPKNE